MITIVMAIAIVWAALLGAAYISRVALRRSKQASAAFVVAIYAMLSAAVLSWYGLGSVGFLSVTGMLVPCLAAVVVVYAVKPMMGSGRSRP